MHLTVEQQELLNQSISTKIFLHGPAGTGKTTAGIYWLNKLIQSGVPAHQILIMVPQRALAKPYLENHPFVDTISHSLITTLTLGSLARRMVDVFWPAISRETGVSRPDLPPNFLTLETAQYYMAHLVRPLIDQEGYFSSLTVHRNRIYSQVLDNLNKSAIIGFPMSEIGKRLKSAWVGDIEHMNIYDDVQVCANLFRKFCLQNNLLDFSLQVEIFLKHLWTSSLCRQHLFRTYQYLIVDNVEEDPPVTHDILSEWIPEFDSALVIFDEGAGYRYFLGADTHSAFRLRKTCQEQRHFSQNQVNSTDIVHLKEGMTQAIALLRGDKGQKTLSSPGSVHAALGRPEENPKYFPDMIEWVTEQVKALVESGTSPGEIVILAPFLPDVLRFALSNQLTALGIPNQAHRPSRSLKDEPTTQTMLSLACLVFPQWGMLPKRINLCYALMHAIQGCDLVRSQLLSDHIYDDHSQAFPLKPFDAVPLELRDRITYQVGQRYDLLYSWLKTAYQQAEGHLDFFMNRLFGEILSQPSYGFHADLDSGNTVAHLVESIQKFRWAVSPHLNVAPSDIGKEYVQMVQDGVIAAQYMPAWNEPADEAVLLSPAYTFLINNRQVDVQFWLDVGSSSWYQRLDQPLTHPYVLSRNWKEGNLWDADNELMAAYDTLQRLSIGLLNRCRNKVYLGMSELDVRGYENRGLLARVFQHVLRQAQEGGL